MNSHFATLCLALCLLVGCHSAHTTPTIVPPQWMGQAQVVPSPVMVPTAMAPGQPQWQQPVIGVDPHAAQPQATQPQFVQPMPGPPIPGQPQLVQPQLGQPQFGQPQFDALPGTGVASTVFVPVVHEEWAWEQIVDVVDDYFDVDQETPVRVVGNVVTEGRIDTFPQVGATLVEPHRLDSVGRYNRWESTFQTIRRRAEIRVVPQQGGYLLDAVVIKELEDLPRPEHSTAGAASFRFDNSLPSRLDERVSPTRLSQFWIPMGRDTALEQQLLEDIRVRLTTGGPMHGLHH